MSGLPELQIIPAGAGSGKTHAIQKLILDWILGGRVRPERIAAVTFTEAAAAELRSRITGELVRAGRVDDALRLSQAYISTIHGFGHRLLMEFAFAAGTSPQPAFLSEHEDGAVVRRALGSVDMAKFFAAELEDLGYRYDYLAKRGPEEILCDRIIALAQLLRTIGRTTPAAVEALARRIRERLADAYQQTGDPDLFHRELKGCVDRMAEAFPRGVADLGPLKFSAKGKRNFWNDRRNIAEAASTPALATKWRLWQDLRDIKEPTGDSPEIAKYRALAQQVRNAAYRLVGHPGPLQHAGDHITDLLVAAQQVLGHFQEAKRQAGWVDYGDMIGTAERLLHDRPEILKALAARIDCLVVDEFQDTSAQQFAFLWRLKESGIPTLVVGDLKQAIMDFQGADPRLFEKLQADYEAATRPLTQNWRSHSQLVGLVNAIGPKLIGPSYAPLEPRRIDSPLPCLDVVAFMRPRKVGSHYTRGLAVAERLLDILSDPGEIVDRQTGKLRKLRANDVAVLCPTHSALDEYSRALNAVGLRVDLRKEGWLESRPIQIAWHALSYLADPGDLHAALYLAVTEAGSLTLEEGLRQLMNDGTVSDPVLRELDRARRESSDRTVAVLVADAIAALRLFDLVSLWPDSYEARANLIRLMGEADEFVSASPAALADGGFHGAGLRTFLARLSAKAKDDDKQPPARVIDEDAVVARTWHSSKGLEWPVVAVCGLGKGIPTFLPQTEIGYHSITDLSNVLKNAHIDYWPRYDAPERTNAVKESLRDKTRTAARRLLYVVLTRARDKLILEWPGNLGGNSASKAYWSILKDCWDLNPAGAILTADGQRFSCEVFQPPENLISESPPLESPPARTGRRAIQRLKPPASLTPLSQSPSLLRPTDEDAPARGLRTERYGPGIDVDVGLSGTDLGSYLHRCFELLGPNPDHSERLAALTGVPAAPSEASKVRSAVARFESWLRSSFELDGLQREWPLLARNAGGSIVSGTADLIVQTQAGVWVIDHKSDRVEDPEESFQTYRVQLDAYRDALQSEGKTVLGVGIHWIRRGEVTWKPA